MELRDGLTGKLVAVMELIVCHSCKVPFMVTANHRQKLINSGETFYCPNGHSQHYTESIEKKFQDQIKRKDQEISQAWNRVDEVNIKLWDLQEKNRELRKQTCPHCKKRYINLDRHILKNHK